MKVNLHTHTSRCGHAVGSDDEYVQAAIEMGYEKLGFSEHVPFPTKCFGMKPNDLEGYLEAVLSMKEKYRDRIEIVLGLECEPLQRHEDYLRQLRHRVDYMILGSHGDMAIGEPHSSQLKSPEELWHYYEQTVYGMDTGLFLYLCHPDIMLASWPVFDDRAREVSRALCRAANERGMPVEYNLLGLVKGHREDQLGYPCDKFWEVAAEENVRAVVGVDAHSPQQIRVGDMEAAKAKLKKLGIQVLDDPTGQCIATSFPATGTQR